MKGGNLERGVQPGIPLVVLQVKGQTERVTGAAIYFSLRNLGMDLEGMEIFFRFLARQIHYHEDFQKTRFFEHMLRVYSVGFYQRRKSNRGPSGPSIRNFGTRIGSEGRARRVLSWGSTAPGLAETCGFIRRVRPGQRQGKNDRNTFNDVVFLWQRNTFFVKKNPTYAVSLSITSINDIIHI